jgi:hypothetical protein
MRFLVAVGQTGDKEDCFRAEGARGGPPSTQDPTPAVFQKPVRAERAQAPCLLGPPWSWLALGRLQEKKKKGGRFCRLHKLAVGLFLGGRDRRAAEPLAPCSVAALLLRSALCAGCGGHLAEKVLRWLLSMLRGAYGIPIELRWSRGATGDNPGATFPPALCQIAGWDWQRQALRRGSWQGERRERIKIQNSADLNDTCNSCDGGPAVGRNKNPCRPRNGRH